MVAVFDHGRLDVRFLRDDVDELRSPDEFESLYDALLFERTKKGTYERLIDAGDLESVSHRFEETVVFAYFTATDRGLVISVDAEANLEEGLLFDHLSEWQSIDELRTPSRDRSLALSRPRHVPIRCSDVASPERSNTGARVSSMTRGGWPCWLSRRYMRFEHHLVRGYPDTHHVQ
jgi:hypothetical protein